MRRTRLPRKPSFAPVSPRARRKSSRFIPAAAEASTHTRAPLTTNSIVSAAVSVMGATGLTLIVGDLGDCR
jgi:hypothetical protein